ncbi:MAG: glutathione S-transferase family protein [Polyangiales bacterium]
MLKLHGFSSSNYYNIVKLALLEKAVPFEEVVVYTGAGAGYRPDYLEASPLGKVPCLQTEDGFLSESRCIIDYLERSIPEPPLYPQGAFAVAKLLELTQMIDLYLELAARRVLPNYFRGKPAPENIARDVRATVEKGALGLARLARLDTYLCGSSFSAADIAAVIHFPMVRRVTQRVLDCDPLGQVPGLLAYLERMEQRPTVQRIRADTTADGPHFAAHLRTLYGIGA